MDIDFNVLKTEIETDPTERGYSIHVTSGSDSEVAALLNERLSTITLPKNSLEQIEFVKFVDFGEVKTLGAAERETFVNLLSLESVPTKTVQEVSLFFGPTTASRAKLQNASVRNASRAEDLFGIETVVTHPDVAKALGRE